VSTRRPAEILADSLLSALLDDAQADPDLRAWAARFAIDTCARLQNFAGEHGLAAQERDRCKACGGNIAAGKTCHRCGRTGPLGQGRR